MNTIEDPAAPLARPVSLLALVERIRAGEVAPISAFDSFAERGAAVDPALAALVATDWAAARLQVSAQASRPLAGLPVGLKDIVDTSFLPTEYGSPIHSGHRPSADAAIVGLLARAGATFPAKTATTEFAFLEPAATRNPWAPERSPGGSSAGSAAAVAAGILPAAVGSQTAGSTVRPASFCGVVGFKPSFGRLPIAGFKPFSPSLDTPGLFTADVDSMRFLFAAILGEAMAAGRPAPGRVTLGLLRTPWDSEATADVRAAISGAGVRLAGAGMRVKAMALPDVLVAADAAHGPVMSFEAVAALAAERRQRDRLSRKLAAYLDEADTIGRATYDAAVAVAASARAASPAMFDGVDALLTFASADVAPPDRTSTGSPRFNRLWTLLGLPCISVPGLRIAGLPIGVQLVGRPAGDEALLEVAATVAANLGDA